MALNNYCKMALAQTHYMRKYDSEGVPFRARCYVPEVDPITGRVFHEREDHAHLLKVCKQIILKQ